MALWQFLQSSADAGALAQIGKAEQEVAAAASGDVVVALAHFGCLRAQGADAANYLHNLLTNDISGLKPEQLRRAGFCTAKGRLLSTFLIWRDGADAADYFLLLPRDLTNGLARKLGMYILRSKVKLADVSEEFAAVGVSGPHAEAILTGAGLAFPAADMSVAHTAAATVLRLSATRAIISVAGAQLPALWETLASKATPCGSQAWRWLDVRDGLGSIAAATQEEFVPQMLNLELVEGVSFRKGCYPGQEIVARSQYLGKVKRRMYRAHVAAAGAPPAPGTHVYSPANPDQASGMVVDATPGPAGGFDLLAVLQTAGEQFRLSSADGPALQLQPLPYAVS
ncbi:MAG: folate-binding protein YgfZ [Rhodocyclaceae bacterium]|nr:folate-binding protein YgfZ [Rhodocyclaceae bacterium]MBX3670008.1 folate-binding protein YgfZ [Rhodocyclaceae bacterium]